ncbi:hypothetical protein DFH29DRAFT_999924 [Suillus ampliporus]|nr:hypothetical protein DFH29DRAFT_999924 [Suillus ampliporus]
MSLIFDRYEGDQPSSSGHHHHRTAKSSNASMSRMHLVHVHRIAMKYIAGHLQSNGFAITVSPWAQGKLYVVSDSPKTIAASLSQLDLLHVKEYLLISEEDCEVLKHSSIKLPNPSWVRIKNGKYKGDIGYVFDSNQSNLFVAVLIPPCDFPYPMPRGSVALLDRSLLLNGKPVSNIIRDEEVVGFSYNGEQYFMGLLLKKFHCYLLDLIAFPPADDILLYQRSGWDKPLVKKTLVVFSMQFLRIGDAARMVHGEVQSEIGTVVSIDHSSGGSVPLEFTFDGHQKEVEAHLQDVEHVFWVGDAVQVVAGSYLGLEGHIVQMDGELFHICQEVSMEQVQVSKYFLDHRPIDHMLQSRPLSQQHFEPPPESESIEVGDAIEVLVGEHMGEHGVVIWFPMGATQLWF